MMIKRAISAILALGILISSGGVFAQEPVWAITKNTIFSSDETIMQDYEATAGYSLSDANGLSYSTPGNTKVVTTEQTTGDDFILDINMFRNFNSLLVFFNYEDENNYSMIKIAGSATLVNVVNGTETNVEAQTISPPWGDTSISLKRQDGLLQLTVNGSVVLDNIEDVSQIDGKYGAGFGSSYGNIKFIKLSNILENEDDSDEEDGVIENLNTESEIEYEFSSDNADENWVILNSNNISYEFQGDKFNSDDTSNIALITKNKFRAPVKLAVGIWHKFNSNRMIFAFVDESNYCYVEYKGTNIIVGKVVSGSETVIGTYTSPIGEGPGWKDLETVITVKKGGKIDINTVYLQTSFNVVSDLEDVAFKKAGGFGGKFVNTPGYISRIYAMEYLSSISSNLTETNFDVNQNAQFEFNHCPDVDTITDKNIIVTDSKGNKVPFTPSLSDKNLIIDFSSPLDYKSEYKITLKKDIFIADKEWGMLEDEVYTFKTQSAPFDITEIYAKNDGEVVYNEDMTSLDGEVQNSLSSCRGENIDVYINTENRDESINATIVVSLENSKGKVFGIETVNTTFTPDGAGYVSDTGVISASEQKIASFNIPDIEDDFVIKYFVARNSDNMNSLYPYTGTQKAESGNEEPRYVMENTNTLKIFGKTDKGAENSYVNISVSSDSMIYKAASVKTGKNGEYSLSFVVNDELLSQSGEYSIKVFGSEMSSIKQKPVYLSKSEDVDGDNDDAIPQINQADETNMLSRIGQYEQLLYFDAYKYDGTDNPYNVISKTELAQMMLDYPNDFTTDNINDFVLESSAVCAYNQGLESYLYGENNSFTYGGIIDFSLVVSGEYGAYNVYENMLTETGKENVRKAILNKGCRNADDLKKLFVQAVVVNSIKHYIRDGFGHINGIITANADKAELNVDKYSALEDTGTVDRNIYLATINSVSDINAILEAIGSGDTNQEDTEDPDDSYEDSWKKHSNSQMAHDYVKDAALEGILKGFTDLGGFDWAKEAIEYLHDNGIVNGKAEGLFAPADSIKREEFVKMLVLALSLKGNEYSNSFEDVISSKWYAPYINIACSLGVVNGINDKEFGIGQNITRQDAAVMIYRALGCEEEQTETTELDVFVDKTQVSDYAKNAMEYMVKNKIMNGVSDTELAPLSNSNRAQIATILYRVINMGGTK